MTLPRLSTLTVRGLRQRRSRSVLMASGVALAVALFVGSSVTNATVRTAIDRLLDASLGTADVVVRPGTPNAALPASASETARRLDGVRSAGGVARLPVQSSVK